MPDTLQLANPAPLTVLTDDEILFRDNIRQFADEKIRPLVKEMDEKGVFDLLDAFATVAAALAPLLSIADWNEVLTPGDGQTDPWWALPPLQLTAHYYPNVIPAAVMDTAKSRSTALLRLVAPRFQLSGVSASNLRASVFPALSWVSSFPEAVNCLSTRLQSGIRALRGDTTIKEATEIQPWITRSHRRRLLGVLLGRPRPETLRVVIAALESDLASAPDQRQPKAA
jgi:hypothetical protein